MKHQVIIPHPLYRQLIDHLFQNKLEQGAFLLAKHHLQKQVLAVIATGIIKIGPSGWQVQSPYYLEMQDKERARVMKIARDNEAMLVECHSHPGSGAMALFSPSDHAGLADFVQYAHWKLPNRPYAAIVWGEESFDGQIWSGGFAVPQSLDDVLIKTRFRTYSVFGKPRQHQWEYLWDRLWSKK
jgi:hypothetical protein